MGITLVDVGSGFKSRIKRHRCINVKSSTYFHMKTKILADFEICISVPLNKSYLYEFFF